MLHKSHQGKFWLICTLAALPLNSIAAELPSTVKGIASAGLISLATTGNPAQLQKELGGEIVSSAMLRQAAGAAALDKLLDISKSEHMAPMALKAPTGEWYAMVAPTITKDNFILLDQDGIPHRLDVGDNEGTHMPKEVTTIKSDGGTPWYKEFWYWIKGKVS